MNSFLEVTQLERVEPGLEPSSDCPWTTPGDSAKALAVEVESGGVLANPYTNIQRS